MVYNKIMLDQIFCSICNKPIPKDQLVYGENGIYYCEKCFNSKKNITRSQLFSNNKRSFYKDRKKWNEYAASQNSKVFSRYKKTSA